MYLSLSYQKSGYNQENNIILDSGAYTNVTSHTTTDGWNYFFDSTKILNSFYTKGYTYRGHYHFSNLDDLINSTYYALYYKNKNERLI